MVFKKHSDQRARALFRIRLAKENLYEAKVGVVEHQKKWAKPGIGRSFRNSISNQINYKTHDEVYSPGTSDQERYKNMMVNKQRALKRKWTTYELHVKQFQTRFPDGEVLSLPTLEEISRLSLEDSFWNIGHLTHPNELWATDLATQRGIQAYRSFRSCDEELRRIARELRNTVLYSLQTERKLDDLKATCDTRKLLWLVRCEIQQYIGCDLM